jgi:hypothetical protein
MADRIRETANRAAEALDSDLLLINSPLYRGLDDTVIQIVRKRRKRKHLHLIIVTSGGDPNAAYRIARTLQRAYETGFTAVVPGYCKSAGTLLVVGAVGLLMGDMSELGPIDVQVRRKDELEEFGSGLTINAAIEALQEIEFRFWEFFMLQSIRKSDNALSFKTAAEIATPLALGAIQPIVSKIEIDRIGEDRHAMNITQEYADRLNDKSQNIKVFEGSTHIVFKMLTSGYPSHGFVIDKEEAEALFSNVEPYPDDLVPLIRALGPRAIYPRGDDDPSAGICGFINEEIADASPEGGEPPSPDDGGSSGSQDGPGDGSPGDSPGEPPGGLPGDV